ncbi:MAG: class I SAM-dependent methyltransferase [Thioalkalivibrionaceae bacterium]
MDLGSIRSSYRRYASVYDWMFGAVFAQGRRRAIERLTLLPGGRVLEVGFGTGLSLPLYGEGINVTGIDISRDMLLRAQRRAGRQCEACLAGLCEMDGERLGFGDGVFDGVVAMYVASVVPNPGRLFAEMWRVCRPGGRIVVINHFSSRNAALRTLESALRPAARFVGFRPDMDLDAFVADASVTPQSVESANLGGYWKLLVFEKPSVARPVAVAARAEAAA